MLIASALILAGLATGFFLAKTNFCTMGALSDYFLFGSTRRLQVLILAVFLYLAFTATLMLAGLVGPVIKRPLAWFPAMLVGAGSFLFGAGMVFAGGCLSRNFTRAASGSVRALCVLALSWLSASCMWLVFDLQELHLVAKDSPEQPAAYLIMLVLCVLTGVIVWSWKQWRFGREMLAQSLALALILSLTTQLFLSQKLPEIVSAPLYGLDFLLPAVVQIETLNITGEFLPISLFFAAGFASAMIHYLLARQFRTDWFLNRADVLRHLSGAMLMGVGGAIAAGGTIGLALSGWPTNPVFSAIACIGFATGCRIGLLQLEMNFIGRFLKLVLYKQDDFHK